MHGIEWKHEGRPVHYKYVQAVKSSPQTVNITKMIQKIIKKGTMQFFRQASLPSDELKLNKKYFFVC